MESRMPTTIAAPALKTPHLPPPTGFGAPLASAFGSIRSGDSPFSAPQGSRQTATPNAHAAARLRS